MMPRCRAPGCRNGCGIPDASVTFHAFPDVAEAAERWAALCGLSGRDLTHLAEDAARGDAGKPHLCSLHFQSDAFETNEGRAERTLRRGAEPSLCLSAPSTRHDEKEETPDRRHPSRSPSATCCSCASRCVTQTVLHGFHRNQIVLNFREQNGRLMFDTVQCVTPSCPQRAESYPGAQHSAQRAESCPGAQHPAQRAESCPGAQHPAQFVKHSCPQRAESCPQRAGSCPQRAGSCPQRAESCPQRAGSCPGAQHPTQHAESCPGSQHPAQCVTPSCSQHAESCPGAHHQAQCVTPSCPQRAESCRGAQHAGSCRGSRHPAQGGGSCLVSQQIVLVFLEPPNELPGTDPPRLPQEPPLRVTSSTQTEITGRPAMFTDPQPRWVRHNSPPATRQEPPRTLSSNSPSEYVTDLLGQHKPSPRETLPSPYPACAPHGPCSRSQPFIKQIVLNFLEGQNKLPPSGVSSPETPRDRSPPESSCCRSRDPQASDERLQERLRKPAGAKTLLRHPESPPGRHGTRPPETAPLTPISQEDVGSLVPKIAAVPPVSEPQPSSSGPRAPPDLGGLLMFEDIAVYFSEDEWRMLDGSQKALYREVMMDGYRTLLSLGLSLEKPDLVSRIERGQLDLWENAAPPGEDRWCSLDADTERSRFVIGEDEQKPLCVTDRVSAERNSHLGALMKLVNEIPGFLLGGSVTDGISSPGANPVDPEFSEIKSEDRSPVCSPSPACLRHLRETPSVDPSSPRSSGETERRPRKAEDDKAGRSRGGPNGSGVADRCNLLGLALTSGESAGLTWRGQAAENSEVAIDAAFTQMIPSNSSWGLSFGDPIPRRRDLEPSVKEESPPCSPNPRLGPPRVPSKTSHHPCSEETAEDVGTRRSPEGSASPRRPANLPDSQWRGYKKVKIKQEESGGDCSFPAASTRPAAPPASLLHQDKDTRRPGASPRPPPADNTLLGNSHLHGLVNCLKEISAGRPHPYSGSSAHARWGAETSNICTDDAVRGAAVSHPCESSQPRPNPFAAAVTNGASRLNCAERRTPETWNPPPGRNDFRRCGSLLSGTGKRFGNAHGADGSQGAEETRRADQGTKRPRSDDSPRPPGTVNNGKRVLLEAASPSHRATSSSPGLRDVWRPPEESAKPTSDENPSGKSHSMSVGGLVKKIPSYRNNPPATSPCDSTGGTAATPSPIGTEMDLRRTSDQGASAGIKTKDIKVEVKEERSPSPPTSIRWAQPDGPRGPSATNIHLTGLMRLMEEIPRSDSSSRAMYRIAVGHAEARGPERTNHSPYLNDDGHFRPESSDNTAASVDSVFSDDTSWSSENDPSYSALDGLQKVVSEFVELGSVSPLVAVGAPPVTGPAQEESGHRKSKDLAGRSPRIGDKERGSARDPAVTGRTGCAAEDGKASYAALCGLEKVVHGFSEQECVSPLSAVRRPSVQENPARRHADPDDGAGPTYSALGGLQKVLNGFSEIGCISPFSAVSATAGDGASEARRRNEAAPADSSYSALTELQKVLSGVPDSGCASLLPTATNPPSDGDPDARGKRKREPSVEAKSDIGGASEPRGGTVVLGPRGPCIDLTQEEPICLKTSTPTVDRQPRLRPREGNPVRPRAISA
ncbi:protein KRBA1 [Spea bombifrons]|uniref:protein KRBA1 n=1 Tax=Spea bombifrons TaxID=233779 RepID=UPI002349536E|nr:protein KRBA1 [Spea bombifrons]